MIWQSAHSMTWIRNEPNFLHLHDQRKGRVLSRSFGDSCSSCYIFVRSFPVNFSTQMNCMNMTWTWAPCSMRRITHLWAIAEGDSPTHQKKATEIPLEVLDHVNRLSTSQPSQIFQSTERPEISKSKTLISGSLDDGHVQALLRLWDAWLFHNVWFIILK